MALGILVLVHLLKKGLYQPGTDKCYRTAQHSSTMGSINMQQHQLQGSSLESKDNNTDIFCNNSREMLPHGVEHLKSSFVCSAWNPSTNWPGAQACALFYKIAKMMSMLPSSGHLKWQNALLMMNYSQPSYTPGYCLEANIWLWNKH